MTWEQGDYVADRAGRMWLVVRDGGMATRAHQETPAGIESIGIAALERDHGPLLRVEVPRVKRPVSSWHDLPEQPWPEAATPTPEQLAAWVGAMDHAQLTWWLDRMQDQLADGRRCFEGNHETRLQLLTRELDELRTEAAQLRSTVGSLTERKPLAEVGDAALIDELQRRLERS